jgi:tetratricopeptide (TPR) repeat protein
MRRLILIVSLLGLFTPRPNSDTEEQLDRYAEEAQRALSEQRYDDAARAFEKLRELSPQTAEVHAQLGAIYFQQHAFAKAVPSLRQALKLKPDLPKVDVLLALCLSELGQFKEAVPGLRKAFSQTEDAPLRRLGGLQLQRAYTDLEQDDKAVEVALELGRLYPDDPEVLYYGGRLFSNFAYLQTLKLRKVAPDSVFMHQAMGEANEPGLLRCAAGNTARS